LLLDTLTNNGSLNINRNNGAFREAKKQKQKMERETDRERE
jgi:hypothetical protein